MNGPGAMTPQAPPVTVPQFPGRLCRICLSVIPPDRNGDYTRRVAYTVCPGPCGTCYGWDEYDTLALVERLPEPHAPLLVRPDIAVALESYCRSVPPDHVVTTEHGVEITAAAMLTDLGANRDGVATRYEAHLLETACAYLRFRGAREGLVEPKLGRPEMGEAEEKGNG